jgi:hypothetical protein
MITLKDCPQNKPTVFPVMNWLGGLLAKALVFCGRLLSWPLWGLWFEFQPGQYAPCIGSWSNVGAKRIECLSVLDPHELQLQVKIDC